MAIEDIVKKIISDAEKKAEEIINSYKKEADNIIAEKKKELKKKEAVEKEKIDKEMESFNARSVQIAQLESRKRILEAKQRLIKQVFEEVKEKIYRMPKEKYVDFIKNKIVQYIETGDEEIIVGNKDKDIITTELIDSLNRELKSSLRENGNLKISNEKTDIEKGFILKQGKIMVNCSLDSILKEAKEKCEEAVVKILYKEKE